MNIIWYEPLVDALRHHIELNHMNEDGCWQELQFLEEHLCYSHFEDNEKVEIGCPWSKHCKCDWTASGRITFNFKMKSESSSYASTKQV